MSRPTHRYRFVFAHPVEDPVTIEATGTTSCQAKNMACRQLEYLIRENGWPLDDWQLSQREDLGRNFSAP